MDVFDLVAKITLDDNGFKHGLEKAGNAAASVAKGMGVALGAAATGVSALAKQAISSYADYEQLVGGVETLFGDSADVVQKYAAEAYKTAGLSANEYMETVTGFSASLLQSVGGDTAKAAEYANTAITDMADNANKMGTDMASIQNAYQGFAKQNYTMLDNLKLGYGGTKTEMERLLQDADKLSTSFNLQKDASGNLVYSYADIVEAIHIVQSEMGITGTTAKEASTTIQGSLASAKSAWQNLLVGIADDNADFDQLIDNFVNSVSTAAGNIIPRIEQSLQGIGKLIEKLAPKITAELPKLVSNVLPSIMSAALSLVTSFVSAITETLPELIPIAEEMITTILTGISEYVNNLGDGANEIITRLGEFIVNVAPMLIDVGANLIVQLVSGLAQNLPFLIEQAKPIVSSLVDALIRNAPALVVSALELILALVSGLIDNIPEILNAVAEIIMGIVDAFAERWDDIKGLGMDIVNKIGDGISAAWDGLVSWFNSLWDGLFGGRNVDVNVNGNAGVNGSHAGGLDYVPFNGYLAELHQGEAVLTSREANEWRRGGTTVQEDNRPIYIVSQVMLDGKKVGESVKRYERNLGRATG